MTPGSAVSVTSDSRPSSAATPATDSGMPMPRLMRVPGISSAAARRPMTFRPSRGGAGHRLERDAELAGEGRAVGRGVGLRVVLGRSHRHAIHQGPGNLHAPGGKGAGLGQPLHLDDDHTAAVLRGHGHRQVVQGQRLPLHADVAVRVGGGPPEEDHVDGEGAVEEPLLAVDLDELDQLIGGAGVHLAAAVPRVDEGVEPHPGEAAGLAGGDVAVEVRDAALREVVGLDLPGERERARPAG